ncbi:aminotransferase class I/II-fold pyridoxal phosphate-dependent enzyme [Candidatus Vidania fulgoroideorum]
MEFPFPFINNLAKIYIYSSNINRYPCSNLLAQCKQKVLSFYGLRTNYNLLIGNGSDEIISLIISSVSDNCYIALLRPTFDMYIRYCFLYKRRFISISLDSSTFNIVNIPSILLLKCSVFFVCYPNNPTGNIFNTIKLLSLIKSNPNVIFVIDEAYYFYSNVTFINYTTLDNVLILRTLSKIGFAGTRIGFLIGKHKLISSYEKRKSPYNIGIYQLNIISTLLTSNLTKLIIIGINRTLSERNLLLSFFNMSSFLIYYNSYCNFVLFRSLKSNFKLLFSSFIRLRNIYIFGIHYYRVSIGSRKEMIPFYKDIFRNDRRFRFRKKNKRD